MARRPSADTTVIAAFAVGFVSFISPCVLPLVPGYLSAVSGVSIAEMRDGRAHASRSVLGPAIIFCLSFTIMFVALGMTATGIGSTLRDHRDTLDKIAGCLIIALGVFFLLDAVRPAPEPGVAPGRAHPARRHRRPGHRRRSPSRSRGRRASARRSASILAAASTSDTVGHGGVLLAFYSLGLAVPFLLTAVAFDRATTAFRWLRDRYLLVTAISGAILIVMGILDPHRRADAAERRGPEVPQRRSGLDFIYSI